MTDDRLAYRRMKAADYTAWREAGGARATDVETGRAVSAQLIVPNRALMPAYGSMKAVTSIDAWRDATPGRFLMSDEPQQRAAAYLRAYSVGWFFKGGNKIANDVAQLDWTVSDGDSEEGEEETTLDRPDLRDPFESLSPIDQFQRLLERPNPKYTGRQLLRKTQVRLDFAGAAAWYLEGGDAGLPSAIYGISPSRMWPSFDKQGNLIGWVMDKDTRGEGVPFDVSEILWFSTGNAKDDDIWGTSIVEAVYSQVPLTDAMARHTATVLSTGGRLAGMIWPKERSLGEAEFTDALRAWRNVTSDPQAAKRLLVFPEPMEYAAGASTPQEIGIPELATLNRDEILTAFPISPYRLGVPTPGGLNSGEVRAEDRRDYWEETIHPRADLLEEFIQVGLLSRYEEVMGQTYDFEIAEPNLDSATSLVEKSAAFKDLVGIGLDPKESLKAVGLDHIKFIALPAMIDPAQQQAMRERELEAQANQPEPPAAAVAKAIKAAKEIRADVTDRHRPSVEGFLDGQRDRVVAALEASLPDTKAARATKADTDWWDEAAEDAELRKVMGPLYADAGRSSLQVVADGLGRIVANRAVASIVADLNAYGTERIKTMNDRTREAIVSELAEGTKRGYSIPQLIDGVPAEGFRGIKDVGLANGEAAWSDIRAETIARTETALSYNRAALDAYKEFNVARVVAFDGDDDEVCAERNGQEYDVDDAMAIEDHPNGTLDWAPVV